MKPSERLKEIEETFRIHSELSPSQIKWLINRVKQLTEALQEVLPEWERDFDSVSIEMGLNSVKIEGNEIYQLAKKALEGEK